jgi:hypothetical protein
LEVAKRYAGNQRNTSPALTSPRLKPRDSQAACDDNRHRRGTGTLGGRVAAELEARGNQVRPLSRHAPEYRVDLATGDGLGPALAGCDVVVDVSNSSARKPAGILVDGSRRLL